MRRKTKDESPKNKGRSEERPGIVAFVSRHLGALSDPRSLDRQQLPMYFCQSPQSPAQAGGPCRPPRLRVGEIYAPDAPARIRSYPSAGLDSEPSMEAGVTRRSTIQREATSGATGWLYR